MEVQDMTDQDSPSEDSLWTPDPVRAWRYWPTVDTAGYMHGARQVWRSATFEAGSHIEEDRLIVGFTGLGESIEQDAFQHKSPDRGCLCGVNAAKKLGFETVYDIVGEPDPMSIWAFAPVELSGTVHEYERGYRAERATIVEQITVVWSGPRMLVPLPEWVAAIEGRYGVPVVVRHWHDVWDEWVEWVEIDRLEREELEVDDGYGQVDQGNTSGTGANGAASRGAFYPVSPAVAASLRRASVTGSSGNRITGGGAGAVGIGVTGPGPQAGVTITGCTLGSGAPSPKHRLVTNMYPGPGGGVIVVADWQRHPHLTRWRTWTAIVYLAGALTLYLAGSSTSALMWVLCAMLCYQADRQRQVRL